AANADYQRRRVRLAEVGVLVARPRAFRFPGESAGLLLKGRDILHVQAVAVDDQQFAAEDWRAAGPFLVIEAQLLVGPENFSGRRLQAGSTERAEMDIHPALVEDRGRR